MKIDDDNGDIQYLYNWGSETSVGHDVCKVIAYDDTHREIVMMGETTNVNLRPDLDIFYPAGLNYPDLFIITMTLHGRIERAYNINYNDAKIYMNIGSHSGFVYNDYFYFGAYSDGFKTRV